MQRPRNPTDMLFVPALGLIWGLNWSAVKIGLTEIAPWTFRSTGLVLAGLLLAGTALLRGNSLAVSREQWLPLLAAGLLTVAGFNVLLAFAQLAALTSRAVIVAYTMPIWATLFARIWLGEKFDRPRILGVILCAAGLTALGWPLWSQGQLSIGLLYALGGGISWAAGTVVTKAYPVTAPPLAIAAWQLLIGGGAAMIGMLLFEGLPVLHALSLPVWLAVAYHVLFAQSLAYLLWFEVIARIPAGVAALGTLMVPAIGVVGAMLIIGEQPTLADYIGLVLVSGAAAAVLLHPGNI
jgi:drug/metabolite transporter (DMT)-like permease